MENNKGGYSPTTDNTSPIPPNGRKNGGYDLEGVIWHQHSNLLMKKILLLWPDKNVPILDLGCGHNFYSNVLKYAGYESVGIDAVDFRGVDIVADITKKLDKITIKANVISLEVGEHIPLELSDNYIDNVCKFGGDVIMSWAIPGQAGVGHINCQPKEWVIEKMAKRGYKHDQQITNELREAVTGCHCTWFQHTLMYFRP